jgi:hypothetical protein
MEVVWMVSMTSLGSRRSYIRDVLIGFSLTTAILAGCGSPGKPESNSAPPTVQTSATTSADNDKILSRHDAPPEGVAAVAAFFNGAGDTVECFLPENPGTAPSIISSQSGSTLRVFERVAICFAGFSEDQPIGIRILQPDGKIRSDSLPTGVDPQYSFEGMPDDPLGEYVFTGTQGAREASIRFRLLPAATPTQRVLREGQDSRPTAVALSGFNPQQQISLHFYGSQGPPPQADPNTQNVQLRYITTVKVQADDNGQAIYPWPTDSNKDSCYGVLADGVKPEQPIICKY